MNPTTTTRPDALPLNASTLFNLYANDAGNWSGSPLVGGNVTLLGDKEDRGLLTFLKRAGLVTTYRDEKLTWINFTTAGINLATERGICLEICGTSDDADEADALARNAALIPEPAEVTPAPAEPTEHVAIMRGREMVDGCACAECAADRAARGVPTIVDGAPVPPAPKAGHCAAADDGCHVRAGRVLTCSCDCIPCHVAEFGPVRP